MFFTTTVLSSVSTIAAKSSVAAAEATSDDSAAMVDTVFRMAAVKKFFSLQLFDDLCWHVISMVWYLDLHTSIENRWSLLTCNFHVVLSCFTLVFGTFCACVRFVSFSCNELRISSNSADTANFEENIWQFIYFSHWFVISLSTDQIFLWKKHFNFFKDLRKKRCTITYFWCSSWNSFCFLVEKWPHH